MADLAVDKKASRAPSNLGTQGRKLWRSIMSVYELRPDEERILEDACREADIIERLEDEQRDRPLTAKGSMGQEVASPMVSELRQHRSTMNALLKSLKLPETDAGRRAARERNSENARKAARARWDNLRAI